MGDHLGDSVGDWLSLYVYPDLGVDNYVRDRLSLLLVEVQNWVGDGERWFYIRYSDYLGPHIRVRVKLGRKQVIKAEHAIASRFESDPNCKLHYNDWLVFRRSNRRFRIAGTGMVRFVRYRPEVFRYGGRHCLAIAEDWFVQSSAWCVGVLRLRRNNYSSIVEVAAVCALHAIECALRKGLINSLGIDWLRYAWIQYVCKVSGVDKCVMISRLREHWQKQSRAWCDLFSQDCGARGCISDVEKESWDGSVDGLLGMYAERYGRVVPFRFHSILGSLIHMHNNRLGVGLADEACILYAIGEYVKQKR